VTSGPPLGPIGIWSRELRFGDPAEANELAAELEELGVGAVWIPDVGGPVLDEVERLLRATRRLTVATGILNVWMHDAAEVAAHHRRIEAEYPGRFLLGLGISHGPIVDADEPGRYRRPLATMHSYLDALDQGWAGPRVLAALGPKMLELARERSLGAHPYLVPAEHTAAAREALGPDRILAPELTVVLERDMHRARELARADLELYLALPHYTNAWLRLGYEERDLEHGGSDRLVDALYACGTLERIGERLREHRDAGADHVCLRVVRAESDGFPGDEWRAIARAFIV
jgi:probable F420-dependent oxidoreductase